MNFNNVDVLQLEHILNHGTREELDEFISNNNLEIRNGKIFAKNSAEVKEAVRYWDKRQLVNKISLNSLYGAILNVGCRFFDKRIGQSTTLTGRMITRHMAAQTNLMLTGSYDHTGETIIYGDTDSVYFSAAPVLEQGQELDLESAVKLYDHISDSVSDTFPQFLKDAFNVPLHQGAVMKAGREVVGQAGLFITKKRYAIKCLDIEGWQPEGGKLKIMGMDIKRSDTPEFIQDFLEEILDDALSGIPESAVLAKIKDFKHDFKNMEPWKKGMPKRVNKLTMYTAKYEKLKGLDDRDPFKRNKFAELEKKVNNMIPGHVTASIHWNYMKKMNSDNYSMLITDGMKVIVCRLKSNPMGYSNIAYPTDELHLPEWFKELPFDEDAMEESVLNKKITNVLGAMAWDLSRIHDSDAVDEFFDFG